MTMTDAASGVTLWRRVADAIEREIGAGTYPAGARLPGEVEIAENFRVNRHTVRRALAALAERGLVRAERGSGTYVEAPRLSYPIGSRTRFSEIVGAGGREPRGRLLDVATEAATPDLARRLAVKAGTELVRIESLRLADGVPICVGTNWLAAARFPDAGQVYRKTGSMTRLLAHHGIRDYRRASTRVSAALVDAVDAARLDLAVGRPVLITEALDVDPAGAPLLFHRARFAAERVDFVVES
jgi:GntR family phosphonate transport system transcriptional regulator